MQKTIIIWALAAIVFLATGALIIMESTQKRTGDQTKSVSAEIQDTEHTSVTKKKIHKKLLMGEYIDFLQAEGYTDFAGSKSSVITVDRQGGISARKHGDVVITAKDPAGNETDIHIKVKKHGFMLPRLHMLTGERLKLDSQFSISVKNITWRSSDKKVARVDRDGILTAKKKGNVRITGTDGKHTFLCSLTVQPKPKSIIYLTFDDGPNRYTTPKVLRILKRNHVKATFFELKPAKADYDLTRRVIKEGHTLAIHGYSHHYDEIYQTDETYHKNLDKLQSLFFHEFDQWCTLTRFPGGSSNTISRHYNKGIMTRLSKKVHRWGYLYFDWNVSSSDAGGARNSKQVYRSVVSGLEKGRGNVVLMHDFTGNDKTIHALERIIRYGNKHGYTFRSLTPASSEVHHGVNN